MDGLDIAAKQVQRTAPRVKTRTVNAAEPVPSGNDGFYVGDRCFACLRIRTTGMTDYTVEIYTRARAGSQFIQAPEETRSKTGGEEYTRNFWVWALDGQIAARISAKTGGNLFLEWSAS